MQANDPKRESEVVPELGKFSAYVAWIQLIFCATYTTLYIHGCAEKKDCLAKHQSGMAGCGWLQPGRNFLST